MAGGWRHEYGENERDYEEFELSAQEEESLRRVASRLKEGYSDEELLRKHINYLENLQKRVSDILQSEQSIGYDNVTLKHDFRKIKQLLARLEDELEKLDPQDF